MPHNHPEFLAGGTDLMERRRSGVTTDRPRPLEIDETMRRLTRAADGTLRVGAATSIDALSRDETVRRGYSGLAKAAAGLATPEIRRMATVAGNLTQRSRCWYYRNPTVACFKKGSTACPARSGNHLYGVAFDLGPCVAPHPSTLGAALLAYGAGVETTSRTLTVAELFGDGRDGTRDHQLAPGEAIRAILLPPPVAGERAHYGRAISRAYAEWPLVEVVACIAVVDGRIAHGRVALGGVAPVPLRALDAERALIGAAPESIDPMAIGALATTRARPLPQTAYKVDLLRGLVADAIETLLRS